MSPWSRLLRAPHRPVAFTVVFWVIIGALVIGTVVGAPTASAGRLIAATTNVVVVVVLWALLPWGGQGSGRWLAPAFLVSTALLGLTVTAGWHFLLVLVAVAALSRAYRLSVAVWVVAAFVITLGAVQMVFTPDEPWRALVEMAFVALGAASGLGLVASPDPVEVRQDDLDPQVGAKGAETGTRATSPTVTAGEPVADASGFPGVELLTTRERDVVVLIGKGRTNREIGTLLYITEGTVKNHVSSALRKLELRDRTQLALRAVAGR